MARERTPQRFIWDDEDEEDGIRILKEGDGSVPRTPEPDVPEPKDVPAPRTPAPTRSR